jgi:hypothetical protein
VTAIGDVATDDRSEGETIVTTGGRLPATAAAALRPETASAWRPSRNWTPVEIGRLVAMIDMPADESVAPTLASTSPVASGDPALAVGMDETASSSLLEAQPADGAIAICDGYQRPSP